MKQVQIILLITTIVSFSACVNPTVQDSLLDPNTGQSFESYDKKWYYNPNTGQTLHKMGDNMYQDVNTGEIIYSY